VDRVADRFQGVQDRTRRVRQWVIARPGGHIYWRALVAGSGGLVVLAGLIMVPLPGPGWLVVFLGLAIWATEFAWAERLLTWTKRRVSEATHWAATQPLWLRAIGTVIALAFTLTIVVGSAAYQGWFGLSLPG
jgi:uncharacterized protein (TIGR02611 family)